MTLELDTRQNEEELALISSSFYRVLRNVLDKTEDALAVAPVIMHAITFAGSVYEIKSDVMNSL